jgi:hypothetical protein
VTVATTLEESIDHITAALPDHMVASKRLEYWLAQSVVEYLRFMKRERRPTPTGLERE